MYLVH